MTNLGLSITTAMLNRDPVHIAGAGAFNGAGVYAIYYTGDYEPYRLIAEANWDGKFDQPIYVGKAVPAGARRGVLVASGESTKSLSSRIREHRESIRLAQNLNADDFYCRWLVVEPIWIPLGESVMINKFHPLWNALVDGFGNHAPGSGRSKQAMSRWDLLHPGRAWAAELPPRAETVAEAEADVVEYLRQRLQV